MNMRWLPFVLLVLLLPAGCKSEADRWREAIEKERRRRPEPVDGLIVRTNVERPVFREDDPIIVYLVVENVSRKDIPVYTELETGVLIGLRIRGRGPSEGFLHFSPMRELVRTKDNIARVSHYVALQPGYYIGRPVVLPAKTLPPGEYSLTVAYLNTFKSCLAKSDFTADELRNLQEGAMKQGLWTGRAISNVVDFKVVKSKRR